MPGPGPVLLPSTVCQATRCLALVTPPRVFCPRHWALLDVFMRRHLALHWGRPGWPVALALAAGFLACREGHWTIDRAWEEVERACDRVIRVAICDEPWED